MRPSLTIAVAFRLELFELPLELPFELPLERIDMV
eukprot:CAMPEP_0173169390 /NCGR_PEP_ID=MMETSP1141-20130122/679_1 /TAXON_ID=483371 /ORGANISM="non described non described, Strain CCMP2298" /LENGTH=34 /DNA_ID= /DNA_START= /DNA_END= /DNA_ORIENTATION=